MSKVAGKMAFVKPFVDEQKLIGGKGIFLGNIDGKGAGHVVIIGGGMVGQSAAESFLCLGARITILKLMTPNVNFCNPNFPRLLFNPMRIFSTLQTADVIIGAVTVKRC